MKSICILVTSLLLASALGAQTKVVDKSALLNDIKKASFVADYCNSWGCECSWKRPQLYLKQDSLLTNSSLEEITDYFHDDAYVLKCYSYLEIAFRNDLLALQLLRANINDSTIIILKDFERLEMPFNQFLITVYLDIIKTKYYYGNSGTTSLAGIKFICYRYGKTNKTIYRKKLKSLYALLKSNKVI